MRIRLRVLLCGLAAVSMFTGCESPGSRARQREAAFRRLPPADQRTVLRGGVHRGMSKEAVYIAWGEPDEKVTASTGQEASESWVYRRQIAVEGAFGSFDQWPAGNNFSGVTVPLSLNAGNGFGGSGNEGMLLYEPHLRIVDATVKTAVFMGDGLDHYDIRQGVYRLAP